MPSMQRLPDNATKRRRDLNELARKLYEVAGYVCADEGMDFQNSQHPQERQMFDMACVAYEHFRNPSRMHWREQL